MSFLNKAIRVAKSVARSPQTRRMMRQAVNQIQNKTKSPGSQRQDSPKPSPRHAGGSGTAPGPNDHAIEYSFAQFGMPRFSYAPANDGDADPGEVVWTWVPYEDDPNQGKDRPVLVLARQGDSVIFAQMTSKDHVDGNNGFTRDDHLGRRWIDMGTGDWDSQGRESEARIDRLLIAHKNSIRREGGRLDKTRFTRITDAVTTIHGN